MYFNNHTLRMNSINDNDNVFYFEESEFEPKLKRAKLSNNIFDTPFVMPDFSKMVFQPNRIFNFGPNFYKPEVDLIIHQLGDNKEEEGEESEEEEDEDPNLNDDEVVNELMYQLSIYEEERKEEEEKKEVAQYDETQFYICGEKNNMINYKGKVFTRLMPIEQIVHMSEQDCTNCETFGSWNGCIVMYCMNCDPNGCGAKYQGIEFNADTPLSAYNTYLKDVNWTTIGDIHLEDSYEIYLAPIYSQYYPEEEKEEKKEDVDDEVFNELMYELSMYDDE